VPAAPRHWFHHNDPGPHVVRSFVETRFDVDLYVTTDLRTMTAIWMGLMTVRKAMTEGKLMLTGDRQIASHIQTWLGLSPFAAERKLASA
jgi:hypothetical protein